MARRKVASIGAVKVYYDSEWEEYQVIDPSGGGYHTSDKRDALDTAKTMNNARPRGDLQVICAWHKQTFGHELVMQQGPPGAMVTHGICPDCENALNLQEGT